MPEETMVDPVADLEQAWVKHTIGVEVAVRKSRHDMLEPPDESSEAMTAVFLGHVLMSSALMLNAGLGVIAAHVREIRSQLNA